MAGIAVSTDMERGHSGCLEGAVESGREPKTSPTSPWTGADLACGLHSGEYSRGRAPEVAYSAEARGAGGEGPSQMWA